VNQREFSAKLLNSSLAVFFPSPPLQPHSWNYISKLVRYHSTGSGFVKDVSTSILLAGYHASPADYGTIRDLAGETRIKLFLDTLTWLINSFDLFTQAMDPDLLYSYPAQTLVLEQDDCADKLTFPVEWKSLGGQFFSGRMIALKWSAIWLRISSLGLPFPPFHLTSGFGTEDVDRETAETLGLIGRNTRPPNSFISFSLDGFQYRLAAELRRLGA
jgi:hypothetical protein